MNIQEAIQHCRDIASNGCDKCSADHKQLAEWLEELVELRKQARRQGKRTTNTTDLLKGYNIGLEEGRREALVEYQKTNPNRDLPSNEVLYKIFSMLFEYQQNNKSSVHMNEYECYAKYIVTNWDK